MFRRIESIACSAVWSRYDGRTSSAPDFERYNLIYGWNASGKTTLSRVIGLFTNSSATRLPTGARVRVAVGQEVLDSTNEQDRGRIIVRVFNRDFVDDNLQRDDFTHAPALFIVGQENIRLSNRIASLGRRRERLAAMYRTVQKKQAEATAAKEKAATDLARECGTTLGVRDFRAPNLKVIAQGLTNPGDHLLNDEGLQAIVAQARDQNEFTPFRSWPAVAQLQALKIDEISKLLKETPQQNAIKRLTDAPTLSDWVRNGLRFHEHTVTCAFCGGNATQALAAYEKHFSDEYRRQHAAIEATIVRLSQPGVPRSFPHEKEWVPVVRGKAKEVLRRLEAWDARQNDVHFAWTRQLREKIANMGTELSAEPLDDQAPVLQGILTDLQQAKDEHDRACVELTATRRRAADKVKAHFAARYSLDAGAAEATEILNKADAALSRVQEVGQKIKVQSEAAHTELQRSSVAANQINDLLKRLLGPRISVDQGPDKQIRFIREGHPASNLSDGERTAISLAYFLVSLGQDGQGLTDQVVFIDDPICSLDANHIYDVAYLLMTKLKPCRQLFISTHNSEFFNTIKQEWTDLRKFKKEHAAFLIHREANSFSQLLPLPSHLTKFRSDYHHVFHCLREFQASTSPEVDGYLGCPNLLRRFLEMYLGSRKPTAKSYLTKLDILFDDEVERGAVARYVDEGSHSASTLRLLEYSDFPALSRGMVERVMRAMERVDPDHYEVLLAETALTP